MSMLNRLFRRLHRGGRPSKMPDLSEGNLARALPSLRARALDGEAQAQFLLGGLYETGRGVPQNFVDAVRWFKAAAEQDSVPAQGRLGEIYLNGRGAPGSVTASVAAHLEAAGEA